MRVFLLTATALAGFCANSLLTRSALSAGSIDPSSFMAIRLITGAVTLLALAALRRARATSDRGSWQSATALAGYAILFTLAYVRIGAAVGALLLFGAVQITMIGTGLIRGERPARIDWLGLVVACIGLLVLTLPGASAPDLVGSLLMVTAGACWGAYSLAGRRSGDPLGATAGNFARASVAGLAFWAAVSLQQPLHFTTRGIWLASASGSLASGVGYTLWYAALPSLAAWRAGVVQLLVPVATAVAATLLLGESLSARLDAAALLVLLGVVLTLHRTARPRMRII